MRSPNFRDSSKDEKSCPKAFLQSKTGLFTGKLNDQVSYASQIWMILGEIPTQKKPNDL